MWATRRMTIRLEQWVEALDVLREHGEHTPEVVVEKIRGRLSAGDTAGADRWAGIAFRCMSLLGGTVQ